MSRKNFFAAFTDGAAAITGHHFDAVAIIKEVAHKNLIFTHCIVHHEHLALNKLFLELRCSG